MSSEELSALNEMLRSLDYASMTLSEQRATVEQGAGAAPEGTAFEPVDVAGVDCEWVTAPGAVSTHTIVSLRGGGYCLGSLVTNRQFSGTLSLLTGFRVLNVGYRNAPEHPFPAALDDVVGAYRWLLDNGVPSGSVSFVGNSAGGGLTLAALLAVRDAGVDLPAGAAVVSPWTDLAVTGLSVQTNADTEVVLDPVGIHETAALYAPTAKLRDPYVSPLYGDLAGLPRLLVHVSEAEILRDDGVRFVERARSAGVEVELSLVEGMPHVWHAFAGFLPEADDALVELALWLVEAMSP